jgi:hypothetical protein
MQLVSSPIKKKKKKKKEREREEKQSKAMAEQGIACYTAFSARSSKLLDTFPA